jgi:hypothetical protein
MSEVVVHPPGNRITMYKVRKKHHVNGSGKTNGKVCL